MNENRQVYQQPNIHTQINNQIEGLRGIGILMIVLYHLFYRYNEIYTNKTFNILGISYWGVLGVALFFMISGCFIIPKLNKGIFIFYLNKILRLWPTYFLCITITFILTQIWALPQRTVSFNEYLLNIFFINGFIDVGYVDGAHWYLTYLLIFILIFGVIEKFNLSNKLNFYLVWIFISFIITFVVKIIPVESNLRLFEKYISIFIGGTYQGYIIIGVMINKIAKLDDSHYFNIYRLENLIIIISFIYILIFKGISAFGGTIFFAILIYMALKGQLKILNNEVLVYLGKISYVLYLIHQNIGYLVEYYLSNIFGSFNCIFLVIALCIVLVIALLLYNYFEKPVQNKINIYIKNLKWRNL